MIVVGDGSASAVGASRGVGEVPSTSSRSSSRSGGAAEALRGTLASTSSLAVAIPR